MTWTRSGVATIYLLHVLGIAISRYAALSSLVLNIVVSVILSVMLDLLSSGAPADGIAAEDYVS